MMKSIFLLTLEIIILNYCIGKSQYTSLEETMKELDDNENIMNCLNLGNSVSRDMERNFVTKDLKTIFHYGSRRTQKNVTLSHTDNEIVPTIDFDITRKTIIIVHGFKTKGVHGWMKRLKDALLSHVNTHTIQISP